MLELWNLAERQFRYKILVMIEFHGVSGIKCNKIM